MEDPHFPTFVRACSNKMTAVRIITNCCMLWICWNVHYKDMKIKISRFTSCLMISLHDSFVNLQTCWVGSLATYSWWMNNISSLLQDPCRSELSLFPILFEFQLSCRSALQPCVSHLSMLSSSPMTVRSPHWVALVSLLIQVIAPRRQLRLSKKEITFDSRSTRE